MHSVAVHGHCRMRVVVRRRPAIIQPTSYHLDKIFSHLFCASKFLSQKTKLKNVFYLFLINLSPGLNCFRWLFEILNNYRNCLKNQYKREHVKKCILADMNFVKNFTQPDFQAKSFTYFATFFSQINRVNASNINNLVII